MQQKTKKRLEWKGLSKQIIACLDRNKAEEIVEIPLQGLSDIADNLIICSGTSSRHAQSLGEHVLHLFRELGLPPPNIEGLQAGEWILLDQGDIMVHIFKSEIRELYQLEKLWARQPIK